MKNMEKEKLKLLESEQGREETDEEIFQHYIEDLRLTPEDFNKKILDVGAGSAKFAKWAKEHGVNNQIYSVEPQAGRLAEREKSVAALAENLPFSDEAFDLVISVASIPNVYLGENSEAIKERVARGLNEMVRVTKSGGEVRLARVLMGKLYDSQRILTKSIDEVIQELERKGMQIEKIRTPSDDTYEYKGHERKRLLAEAYLLIIRKPALRGGVNK